MAASLSERTRRPALKSQRLMARISDDRASHSQLVFKVPTAVHVARESANDEEEATMLVDVETESVPTTDEDGNLLYYCIEGQHIFSVDEDDRASPRESRKRR